MCFARGSRWQNVYNVFIRFVVTNYGSSRCSEKKIHPVELDPSTGSASIAGGWSEPTQNLAFRLSLSFVINHMEFTLLLCRRFWCESIDISRDIITKRSFVSRSDKTWSLLQFLSCCSIARRNFDLLQYSTGQSGLCVRKNLISLHFPMIKSH